ncbi:MAG TPA: DoxX family protein [Alphaproteobacteria bacterium]|nr:DoxX family protein [Alphaproteobacteria bacterium]
MAESDDNARLIIPALGALYRPFKPLAWPLIRFATGLFLVPHGAQKLFGWFGGHGLDGTIAGFSKMGFEPGWFFGPLVGGVEFFGGILIALGLLTRPAAVAAAILLAVAFTVHLPNGFFVNKGGYEYALLWLILCTAIAARGAGRLSLDRAMGREF